MTRADALGRVLARPVHATVDVPMADVSAMDGYALAGAVDTGQQLEVVATAAAGRPVDVTVTPGTAAKIMTGAVVPRGADRVIPVELTGPGDGWVVIAATRDQLPAAGRHIRRHGEVIRHGDVLLDAGRVLVTGAIAELASHGVAEVAVWRRPRVAVLVTGDEVVPPDQEPGPGQLRDSNGAFLVAAGRTLGLEVSHLGIAGDHRDALRDAVEKGLAHDVLLLSGGVSMGEFDFVDDVLGDLGCHILFDKVAIQPGKPLVVARREESPGPAHGNWIFGLPGNPASVMVTFWLFVRPLLRRLMGHDDRFWHGAVDATLDADLPRAKGRDRFLPARLRTVDGGLVATPFPPVGSHDTVAYGRADALVRIPPHQATTAAGGRCRVLPIA